VEHARQSIDLYQRPLFDGVGTGKRPTATEPALCRDNVPVGFYYAVFSPPALPGWDSVPATVSKEFGERWCSERRSAILLLPSVVTRLDHNVLINPAHPEFAVISASLHQPVYWDSRLFGS
jgi:hypothetical protein